MQEGLFIYAAPFIGLVTLVIGICAVLWPRPMAVQFGIAADPSALPFVVSMGIRDVFMGLTVLILFFLQHWVALGFVNLCLGIVAVSDFIIVRRNGSRKASYTHLAGAILVSLYALWLIAK